LTGDIFRASTVRIQFTSMMASHKLMGLGRRKVGQRLATTISRSCVARNDTNLNSIQPKGSLKFGDRYFSTDSGESSIPSRYAVVDHSEAYEREMSGRHGAQLELAKIYGLGKDEPAYDPFKEQFYELLDKNEDELLDKNEEDNLDDDLEDDARDVETEAADFDDDVEDDGQEKIDEESEITEINSNAPKRIRRKKSQVATLAAGAPAGGVFAVVRIAGAQHKVTEDDVVILNKLKPVEKYAVGSVHTLTDVLMMSSSHLTLVGMPVVAGAEVDVMVEEITQDKKIVIFKNRRRKNSRRKNGFRREVTLLRILEIRMPEEYKNHKHNLGEYSMEAEA